MEELKRFKKIFAPKVMQAFHFLAGNHDVGFGENIVPLAYARFNKTFGPLFKVISIGSTDIIFLETLSLSASRNNNLYQISDEFLSSQITSTFC